MNIPPPPDETDEAGIRPELNLTCEGCGYSLTGLRSRRCPECGMEFDIIHTLRINRRSSYEYLLENRCTWVTSPFIAWFELMGVPGKVAAFLLDTMSWVFPAILLAMVVTFFVLAWADPLVLFVLLLFAFGEAAIWTFDRGRVGGRLTLWCFCLSLAVLIWWV